MQKKILCKTSITCILNLGQDPCPNLKTDINFFVLGSEQKKSGGKKNNLLPMAKKASMWNIVLAELIRYLQDSAPLYRLAFAKQTN